MRCPQYARYKPQKRASGALKGIGGHMAGKGTVTVTAEFVAITLPTFRQRDLGAGLKGMPKAQRDAIKARRAGLTMTKPVTAQAAEPPRTLCNGVQKREGYKSRDDRHRHYAWKGITP